MLIKGNDRMQMVMQSMDDCIGSDNPVRLIDALVEKLELDKLGITGSLAKEGRPAYDEKIFLKLYIYGYLNRVRSSRRLEKECERNKEVCWLLQELRPCYKSIADFRKDNAVALRSVFRLFTGFLREQKLVEGETVAVDGCKYR